LSSVRELLRRGIALLGGLPGTDPTLDARLLLMKAAGLSETVLWTGLDAAVPSAAASKYLRLVDRRRERVPLAYLTGEKEFWSLSFRVSPGVLIPRPETELLVEVGRDLMRTAPAPLVVDVGTGSGAILLALAGELAAARLVGLDVSPDALLVARENLRELGGRVELLAGDLLEPLPAGARPELIVSNPPYIASAAIAGLEPEVRDWEPALALDGGPDGLAVIRRLIPQAAARLAPSGWLALEIGHDQAAAVSELLRAAGLDELHLHQDLAGHDRVLAARRRS